MTSSQVPSRMAMPCPFGGFGSNNTVPIAQVTGSDVNYVDGFPEAYGAPSANNGKFVRRKQMNAIGKLASNDLFYHKCGGLNTFDADFCAAVSGYPKGAILEYVSGTQIYNVMSLVDNNKVDFTGADHSSDGTGISSGTVDGINWTYCNKDAPSQHVINVVSGDGTGVSVDSTYGSIVSYFTSSANGMLTASIFLEYGTQLSSEDVNCITTSSLNNVFISGGIFIRPISKNENNITLSYSNAKAWTCVASAVQVGRLAVPSVSSVNNTTQDVSLYPRCYTLPTSGNPSYGSIIVSAGTTYAVGIVMSPYVNANAFMMSSIYKSGIRYSGYNVNVSIV